MKISNAVRSVRLFKLRDARPNRPGAGTAVSASELQFGSPTGNGGWSPARAQRGRDVGAVEVLLR